MPGTILGARNTTVKGRCPSASLHFNIGRQREGHEQEEVLINVMEVLGLTSLSQLYPIDSEKYTIPPHIG